MIFIILWETKNTDATFPEIDTRCTIQQSNRYVASYIIMRGIKYEFFIKKSTRKAEGISETFFRNQRSDGALRKKKSIKI